jgi:lipopolysaccharide transport system ATP-binding protein
VFGTNTDHLAMPLVDLRSGERVRYRFSFGAGLGPGGYSVAIALHSTDTHVINNYEWRDLALVFNVVNMSRPSFVGNAWLPPGVSVERYTAAASGA